MGKIMIHRVFILLAFFSIYLFAQDGGFSGGTYKPGAREFNGAVAAYTEGDYQQTIKLLTIASRAGHAEAQFRLGLFYYTGDIVEKDYRKALFYFELASTKNLNALYLSAVMHHKGLAGAPDLVTAAERYRTLAVRHGHAESQTALAGMYYVGAGVERDLKKAAEFYKIAADQGHREAMYNLGLMCEHGQLENAGMEEAIAWYEKASENGEEKSSYKLAMLHAHGLEIEQNKEKAVFYLKRGVEQGNSACMLELAKYLLASADDGQSHGRAITLLEGAKARGRGEAAHELAVLYINAASQHHDAEKARENFEDAVELGSLESIFMYGLYLYQGIGFTKNEQRGLELIRQAASQKYRPAIDYCETQEIDY